VEIAYVDVGSGEPVALLHGSFCRLNDWLRHPIHGAWLNAGFRVIAMDARGHGQSDKPHDPAASGPEMADDVARLLDHLGIPQAHVMGYSMGGDWRAVPSRGRHRYLTGSATARTDSSISTSVSRGAESVINTDCSKRENFRFFANGGESRTLSVFLG
jgi:pimeloyl-ACP methyl ester carboxylesterase